ncbi:MAG: Fur family transcriptional regulator, ferric uptake regulator [Acetobacteraceae bacterium]|jgi:Fur family ferric uptake transcriptional regulator|nr:Fur family transcriptional regulator, ferric uptake regulator [Acetobacteraceae bacterium]
MESRIERLCIERGLKMTGQRRVVARVLSEAGDHPDVEELYRRASALDQHISIATVYRTVRLFEEQGILERRDFGGGRARYEPSEDGPHYHLIDVETGKVIEFQDPEHERLMHAIAARLGFDVVSLRLELFGRRRGAAATPGAKAAQSAPDRPSSDRPSSDRPLSDHPGSDHPESDHLGADHPAPDIRTLGHAGSGDPEAERDLDGRRDSDAVSRDQRLRDTTKGASR